MATAPKLPDYLNEESAAYFGKVKHYLDILNIKYEVDPNLVRGLDYYNHTAFEIKREGEGFGAITTLAGGGRYNGLVEDLGGPESPGIGFGMSIERLLLALEAEGQTFENLPTLDVYVVAMGDGAKDKAVSFVSQLRQNNVSAEMDYLDRKVKAQMKSADRLNAKFSVVIGDNELESGKISLKYLANGNQQQLTFEEIVENFTEIASKATEELA